MNSSTKDNEILEELRLIKSLLLNIQSTKSEPGYPTSSNPLKSPSSFDQESVSVIDEATANVTRISIPIVYSNDNQTHHEVKSTAMAPIPVLIATESSVSPSPQENVNEYHQSAGSHLLKKLIFKLKEVAMPKVGIVRKTANNIYRGIKSGFEKSSKFNHLTITESNLTSSGI